MEIETLHQGPVCPIAPKEQPASSSAKVLSRVYINENGDLIVTDLWNELEEKLGEDRGFSAE